MRVPSSQPCDKRMHRHDVIVDHEVEAGKLTLERGPIDVVASAMKSCPQERAGAPPGGNAGPE